MTKFIGRQEELETLRSLFQKKSASLIVIRGRRRIGKSRLIQEFGRSERCYIFTGLPPTSETTKQQQIDSFLSQLAQLFDLPEMQATSWYQALWLLCQQCKEGRMIVALDEISWLASKDNTFLGELKAIWDLYLSQNPELIVILCGSVSSWIEENILAHTGFVGRISLDIQLKELPLSDIAALWTRQRGRVDRYEMLKMLSVTGGVPRYLEELHSEWPMEENIRRLCFTTRSLLFREYDQIFSELFEKKAPLYTQILEQLAKGPKTRSELKEALGVAGGGHLTTYLRHLLAAGFIAEDAMWNLHSTKPARLTRYRLSDNYVRFYLRCIAPNRAKIAGGTFSITNLDNWSSIMGLQFENLVLSNVLPLLPLLGVTPGDVTRYGPFLQKKTQRRKGCQVDLLIQLRHRVLYLCEIKFSAKPIGMSAAHEMEQKCKAITVPKGYSMRTALIHVNGVTEELEWSHAFDHIIDFGQLLGH